MKTKPHHALPLVLLVLALVATLVLRFAALEARPMHADEAVQAYIFSDLLERGDYRYDPAHYHGPLPHFINLPLMHVLGINDLDTMQAWQFRVQPAVAGVLLVLLVVFAAGRRREVRWRAAVLAGVSPLLVYFSRMAIHETLLACCALAVPLAVARWLVTWRTRWLVVAGMAFGCMQATKETWSIIAFSWAVAAFAFGPRKLWHTVREVGGRRIVLAGGVAMAVSFLLYSCGGRHPEGFADAWGSLFAYRTGGGHAKPWFYYFADVIGFYPAGGWLWGEGVIVLLALAGLVALRKRRGHGYLPREARMPAMPRFLAVSAVVQIAVYSIIKYKTPWLMLVPAAYLVPMAAYGWPRLEGGVARRVLAGVCSVAIAGFVLVQTVQCVFLRPTDPMIPVVYAPTLPDADRKLAQVVDSLPAGAHVAVIGEDYWPLPWYFRARRLTMTYYTEAEVRGLTEVKLREKYTLMIRAGSQLEPEVLRAGFLALDLRPGYYLSVQKNVVK